VRKLIVSEFVTLDGVMEAPGGEEGHPHVGRGLRGGVAGQGRRIRRPIGSGRRLFPETPDKTVLQLADTQAFDSGVVVHTYRPGASPR